MSIKQTSSEGEPFNPYAAPDSQVPHTSTNWVFPRREIINVRQLEGSSQVLVDVHTTPSQLMTLFGFREKKEEFTGGGGRVKRQMYSDKELGAFRELQWLERLAINKLLRDWRLVHKIHN